ncbi:hypothetical protein B0T11DRAFT_5107 [Plectosphaerella cucumerina]|uniref:Uncharacterized protein n=1 Tax=Plectosphaerella cucumerina TaxID=40658 RepID=A0A8K0TRA0_9PEZI|nr:hypothetical protein B0T11DRAFT_5107 [Plectosphaerella cucumerina]
MAQSFFRYNLSRRFPFGWFTYAVVIGGLLLLVLFSALNFSANAYELKVVYTNDPSSTLAESDRETRWPISLMGKLEGSCTPREIPLGARLYTNKRTL